MSFSETLKTRNGVKKFVLPTGSGNEDAFALEYSDKKVEAHQMKHACAPLYLDENSKVAIISCDQVGSYLLSATLDLKQGGKCCLAFKAWDSASVLGFTPIEIHIDGGERTVTQDGKFRYLLPFLEEPAGEPGFMIDSLGTCVALLIETDVLIWKILKELNILSLQLSHSLKLKPNHQGLDLCLLRFNASYSISVMETGSFSIWNLNDSGVLIAKTISFAAKSNGTSESLRKIHRLTTSNAVFTDDDGKLWMFSCESNCFSSIKLPGLVGGCDVFAVTTLPKSSSALLAVCHEGHTVNIYSFDYTALGSSKETIYCQRPIKILFSSVPVDAMGFLREDTLALSSSSNRTITIWTGISDCMYS
ncbi:uncharacterized protein LOC135695934 isoform X2 [Rhopilema esculentum]|uniref:uncharacterized protein LOC135695934 isoform X2 n=1 Tax=Rhopilema esculentum TaxID=499914 RepID=UPI0031DA5569